jgi:hypothetical protein
MKTLRIFKYPIERPEQGLFIRMPKGAVILTVQTQNETPCIWALVDESAEHEMREFRMYGTGHEIKEDIEKLQYVGTFQLRGGSLVFHLFELWK